MSLEKEKAPQMAIHVPAPQLDYQNVATIAIFPNTLLAYGIGSCRRRNHSYLD